MPNAELAAADPDRARGAPLVEAEGLEVGLPDGRSVLLPSDLRLRAGEVVALLGPSGAGKTTLVSALLEPEKLVRRGYRVAWRRRELSAEVAFVPQRGALFDHLDVGGNIELAQLAAGAPRNVEPWLDAVGLDRSLAHGGTSVATLSGGQAQRLAVARTLAAGRRVLVLDEPSVGLDPLAVRNLAKLLLEQSRAIGAAVLLITHDLTLAAGACRTILFLHERRLVRLQNDGKGPAERMPEAERAQRVVDLEREVVRLLAGGAGLGPRPKGAKSARESGPSALRVLGAALVHVGRPKLFGASARVFLRGLRQSLLAPLPFYAVVGALLGFTVLFVIAKMSGDIKTASMLRLVGGTYILSLAPPLSAVLFAATSGNVIAAWLGSVELQKQTQALEGLGVPVQRYLWATAWASLFAAYLLTVLAFIGSMILGGWVLFRVYGASDALTLLTSDFLDPAPARTPYLVRGAGLVLVYAIAIATIATSRGVAPKNEAADVTRAMTSSVIRSTLFVVAMELASVALLFSLEGKR
ncbi:MAG: ATP-binding cassette domain-containing protein [Polyangiaceae bacterium]